MHALRQDQELQALTRAPTRGTSRERPRGRPRLRRAAALAVAALLALPHAVAAAAPQAGPDTPEVAPRGAEAPKQQGGDTADEEGPGAGDPPGADRPDAGRKAAPRENQQAGPARGPVEKEKRDAQETTEETEKEEPRRVPLPSQGVYPASELARLAGKITGRSVHIGDTGVERRRIEVIPLLAGQAVTLEELKLLLAFHGIYLFDSVDPEEGEVLVATTDPRWHPRQARYSQVLEVSALGFKRVWSRLKAAIDEHNAANAARPQPEADVVAVPVESVGKIFIRAPNKKTLASLVELAQGADAEEPPADRMRLFAYVGRYRHVRELEKLVVEELSAAERSKTRFVVMASGNRLLYRAPARLGERIRDRLERADRRRR